MTPGHVLLAILSLLLVAQSGYSAALMLYAWEDEEKDSRRRIPATYEPPATRFTLLLPARHEEAVIDETIQRTVDLHYPRQLVQILVVIESGDTGTIAVVESKIASLRERGITHVRLLTFAEPPINKPHGLNVGLQHATGDIVTIFDAEDGLHPDILQVVNTVAIRERAPVVQCGVQLMNYGDRWFSALNVLEYFFWFKSRMHYHAGVGMVPLGGNTVFMRRDILQRMGGWDQYCLTEDADIGIRLSAMGLPIRVLYDDQFVTQEETPPTVGQFIRQRTRWNQGFLQVLFKGQWLRLHDYRQRLLALYTLSFPALQSVMMIYVPVSIWMMLFVKVPVLLAIISSLPLYMLAIQLAISIVGLYEFTDVHHLQPSPLSPFALLTAYIPYQMMLNYAALRAAWRQIRGNNTWEKTAHIGAHRSAVTGIEPGRLVEAEEAAGD
jgi:cellulose synthase/poly-beta-1,6-N-acetylglucosamine synthase-like glycosyltransferase